MVFQKKKFIIWESKIIAKNPFKNAQNAEKKKITI